MPGPVLSWRSAGVNALLRDGAVVIRDAADAVELALGVDGGRRGAADPRLAGLPIRSCGRCSSRLTGAGVTADALAADACALDAVLCGLAELELRGLVRRGLDGRWAPVA